MIYGSLLPEKGVLWIVSGVEDLLPYYAFIQEQCSE
jgi:hypothetical protein